MGGVLSKGRPAAPSVDTSSQHVKDENAANGHDAQNITAAASAEQNGQLEVTHIASPSQASDSAAASTSKLPQDMQFILESGLHEDQEPDQAATANGRQGSIQDAVNDIKAKYNLNQPVATGELERIRKEIELKTRLMQMREAQQQKRMAAAAAASAINSTSSTSTSDELGSSAKLPAYKVDVKGKGRADQYV